MTAVPGQALAGTATPASQASDCRVDGAKSYDRFGHIQLFTKSADLYGCVTNVGRVYRLNAGNVNSTRTRRTIFGAGDWIGFPSQGGQAVRAINLRTGRTQSTSTPSTPTSLAVNFDGTLAWIAAGKLRAKPLRGSAKVLGTGADANFLGLELEGCAVTWKVGGEQRSSSIFCASP